MAMMRYMAISTYIGGHAEPSSKKTEHAMRYFMTAYVARPRQVSSQMKFVLKETINAINL